MENAIGGQPLAWYEDVPADRHGEATTTPPR